MVDFKVRTCKLCFTIIEDENYEVIDSKSKNILIVNLLKLDFDDDRNHEMCNVCSAGLFAAQNFKQICLYTENAINQYVDTTVLPFDLREIYMRESTGEHISEDVKICRLCMQSINDISEFESINDEHVDMIQKLIPEMNIFTIQEPVICKTCQDSLGVHCKFLNKCWNAEQCIENGSNVPTPEPPVKISVKIEHVDTEFEDVPELKKECMDINYEEIKTETESKIHGHEITWEEPAACRNSETQCYSSLDEHKIHMYQSEQYTHALEEHRIVLEDSSTPKNPSVQKYKRTSCNCETKNKSYLKEQVLIQKYASDVKIYKCEHCTFETKQKGKSHILRDPLEVKIFKCENCNYTTTHKQHLKQHMLVHKDRSETQMYKCESCNYETILKKRLERHMLVHKDPSEMQMYKCNLCNFETIRKYYLKHHMVVHKDPSEVKMYKCETCDYETKFGTALRNHLLLHQGPLEAKMHKCETCNYETKYKCDLKKHLLLHTDPSKVQMYKCEHCNFETIHKQNLNKHMLVHKDPSEVQMYKCEDCTFETKRKRSLKSHIMLKHKDPSEVKMYICENCDYRTRRKGDLSKHMFSMHKVLQKHENKKHKSSSEIQI